MRKLFFWICEKRVLDGYIGILGFVIWYRLLATYGTAISILYISCRPFFGNLFTFDIQHYHKIKGYPVICVNVSIFGFKVISNTSKQDKALTEWFDNHMKEWKKRKAEEEEIIKNHVSEESRK